MARKKRSKKNNTPSKTKIKKKSSPNVSNKSSPFKGFENEEILEGDSIFDRLVDENRPPNLNRHIRTYSNKKKKQTTSLLQFEDCRNRDEILNWLNDNRNNFERLTQTQSGVTHENEVPETSIDLPSVSQESSPAKRKQRLTRSPYRLRARSLDAHSKKNLFRDRCMRHSLNGDTTQEDYFIEDGVTDEEPHSPVEDVILDLMEDVYLDNVEKELQQKKQLSGWERLKDFSQSVRMKKTPKQLDVTLESPLKKDTPSIKTYDYNVLEQYFNENMLKLIGGNQKQNIDDVLECGRNFLNKLQDVDFENSEYVERIVSLIGEIKLKCHVLMKDCSTQTCSNCSHKGVQTIFERKNASMQTMVNQRNSFAQTCALKRSQKLVQTEMCHTANIEIQTDEYPPIRSFSRASSTSTASDLFFKTEEVPKSADNRNKNTQDGIFDDDFNFDYNTEDFLKTAKDNIPNSKLQVSTKTVNAISGRKRECSQSPVKMSKTKRPCDRFVPEDLSLGFDSCTNEVPKPNDNLVFSEESDVLLLNACRKYEAENVETGKEESQKPPEIENLGSTPKIEEGFDYFNPSAGYKTPKSSRQTRSNSQNVFSDSLFIGSDIDLTVLENKTLTPEVKRNKINIIENIVLKKSDDVHEQDLSDEEVVEGTPRQNISKTESVLDVTLPPPYEFQDLANRKEEIVLIHSPPRRPLAVINKITSTPLPNRLDSEQISLSPITVTQNNTEDTENSIRRERKFILPNKIHGLSGVSKFGPLSIVRNPQSDEGLSKQQKSILNYLSPTQKDGSFPTRKPCIACSRISREQVMAISKMTNKKLASYSSNFTSNVTHLIVAVNERKCLMDHTIKFISAVASGIWILSFQWVEECLAKNYLVPEEPYEVLDVSGTPGPRISRLTRLTNPLLRRYRVYVAPPFVSTTQKEVENVVKLLGGQIAPSPEHLLDKNGYICIIITEARATQDFELYETWLEALKVLTVDIEWLSRSVGEYKLLSFKPFTLCSDDCIDDLGYPSELTKNMTYSFSQQTFNT